MYNVNEGKIFELTDSTTPINSLLARQHVRRNSFITYNAWENLLNGQVTQRVDNKNHHSPPESDMSFNAHAPFQNSQYSKKVFRILVAGKNRRIEGARICSALNWERSNNATT